MNDYYGKWLLQGKEKSFSDLIKKEIKKSTIPELRLMDAEVSSQKFYLSYQSGNSTNYVLIDLKSKEMEFVKDTNPKEKDLLRALVDKIRLRDIFS